MALPRSAILAGPASVTYNSKTIQSQSDIEWRLDYDTFDIESSAQGFLSRRANDRIGRVTFTPMGCFSAADTDGYQAIFYPYAEKVSGTKLIGAADKTLDITASDGIAFNAQSAVLTRVPDLILSANKMLFGQAEFSCVMPETTGDLSKWKDADKFIKISALPAFASTVARSRVLTLAFTATWNLGTDITEFHTADGWNISFDLRTTPIVIDALGTVDWLFQDLIVRARCKPIVTDAQMKNSFLAIEDTKMQRGADFAELTQADTGDLVITGSDALGTTTVVFTLKRAVCTQGGYQFSSSNLRPGEVEFIATKTGTSGDVMYTLAGTNP